MLLRFVALPWGLVRTYTLAFLVLVDVETRIALHTFSGAGTLVARVQAGDAIWAR